LLSTSTPRLALRRACNLGIALFTCAAWQCGFRPESAPESRPCSCGCLRCRGGPPEPCVLEPLRWQGAGPCECGHGPRPTRTRPSCATEGQGGYESPAEW